MMDGKRMSGGGHSLFKGEFNPAVNRSPRPAKIPRPYIEYWTLKTKCYIIFEDGLDAVIYSCIKQEEEK